jgi:hypothetical protein
MFQHLINAESYPLAQLCVNTLLATKVTLITDGIKFGTIRIKDRILYKSKCCKFRQGPTEMRRGAQGLTGRNS